jgi:hypothetical protein
LPPDAPGLDDVSPIGVGVRHNDKVCFLVDEEIDVAPEICDGVGLAWTQLALAEDPSLDPSSLGSAVRAGCDDALTFCGCSGGSHGDTDMDGVVDEFGELWAPDSGVDVNPSFAGLLSLQFTLSDGEPREGVLGFKGVAE